MEGGAVMTLRKFANIGKAVLTNALGLQKNYSEVVEKTIEVLDKEATGCDACKWELLKEFAKNNESLNAACCNACDNCPHKCFTTQNVTKKVYFNERNRYGYLPRLKTNAIKLFIAYHMLGVDANGFVRNINVKQMAELLNCNIKTIRNNNDILKMYGYICYSVVDVNTINIYIPAHQDYYLPAQKGGRGFLAVSDTVFEEILKMNSLNELRIALRQLMSFDILTNKGITSEHKSIKELRNVLPDYCRPNIVKKAAASISLFEVHFSERTIKFDIKDKYNAKIDKISRVKYYENLLSQFLKELNEEVVYVNTSNVQAINLTYSDFFEHGKMQHLVYLTEVELEDLAVLATQYSYDIVIKAFSKVYKTYYSNNKKPDNLGGLVHSFILSFYKTAA